MTRADSTRPSARAAAAAAAFLTLFLIAESAAAQTTEACTLTGRDVAIYNLIGTVTLVAGAGNAVEVQVATGGPDAAQLAIKTGEIDGRQTLRIIYPSKNLVDRSLGGGSSTTLEVKEDGTFNGDLDLGKSRRVTIRGKGDGLEAHANLTVAVPAGIKVRVHQGVGKVTADGVTADLILDTASAPVTATGIHGSLHVDVGSGEVHASDIEGRVSIDTGSGDVDVRNSRGDSFHVDTGSGRVTAKGVVATNVSVDTGSGEIDLTEVESEEVSLDTGSGSISVDLEKDIDELAIDTGSGDVHVGVPSGAGAEVRIEASSGDIDVAVPHDVRRDHGSLYRCTIGDGDGTISIETASGDVTIEGR